MSLTRENYFWHKVHSLTGIVPIGFYMLQHLTLNSFSLAGPDKFNGVIGFFESLPPHLLIAAEALLIWIPLLFHAIYGFFIVGRAQPNAFFTKYGWSQNRMYTLQRWSGLIIFVFLLYHVLSTTVNAKINGVQVIQYQAWHEKLTSAYFAFLIFYMIGVLASSYHLAYGIWNFCIRWGITISERSQLAVQRFSFVFFIAVTLLGWLALFGFLQEPNRRSFSIPEGSAFVGAGWRES